MQDQFFSALIAHKLQWSWILHQIVPNILILPDTFLNGNSAIAVDLLSNWPMAQLLMGLL
jgi:hypothetical protein